MKAAAFAINQSEEKRKEINMYGGVREAIMRQVESRGRYVALTWPKKQIAYERILPGRIIMCVSAIEWLLTRVSLAYERKAVSRMLKLAVCQSRALF